jgi:hypothetical protein
MKRRKRLEDMTAQRLAMKLNRAILHTRTAPCRYLFRNPTRVPGGRLIVHNHAPHDTTTKVNREGFRAWALPEIELTGGSGRWQGRLVPCECGWAALPHYRVKLPGLAQEDRP